MLSPLLGMLGSIWPITPGQIKEAVDNELLSLLNTRSREGEGNWGDRGLCSLQHLLQSWPLGGWHGDGWWSDPPSLEASFIEEPLGQSNLKGCWAGQFTHGHPGPLTYSWWPITAWAMAHQPSWIVMGSAARKANFPTHVPAPVSKNAASLASSAVRPSPIECLP